MIEEFDEQITELKGFNTLGHTFLCKILHRFDFHVVNSKVVKFNELHHERFSDTEEFITVINTISPEFKFYYEDGLHFRNVGLSKFCSILLSNLYRVFAPSKLVRRRRMRFSYSHSWCHDGSSSLILGCWNLHCFRTAQIYFEFLIDQLYILAISEHCLFQEQLGILKSSRGNTYNCIAASANDNPPILSRKVAHGGVVLLWKVAIDDYNLC